MNPRLFRLASCALVVAFGFAAFLVAAPAEAQRATSGPRPLTRADRAAVITVNQQKILRYQYDRAVDQDVRQALARFGIFDGVDPRDTALGGLRRHVEGQVRERLVHWLVLLDAARKARVRVPADSVTAAWREATSDFGSDSELREALRLSGRTRQEVQQDIRDNLLIDAFLTRRIGTVTATESEARAFFLENRQRYATPETVRARHILIRDTDAQARIAALRRRILAGEDFAALAREHSQDGSAPSGGDLGSFGRGQMVPPFEEAAFALPVGQVSEPVETRFGWHLIKVEEHRAAAAPEFEDVRGDVERRVAAQKRGDLVRELIETLKSAARVRILLPELPAPEPPPAAAPGAASPTAPPG